MASAGDDAALTTDSGQQGGQAPVFGRREPAGELTRPIVPKSANEALRPEPGTPPPIKIRSRKSRSQVIVFLNFLMTIAMLAALGAGALVYLGKQEFDRRGPTAETRNYEVKRGAGIGDVAAQLENQGLISNQGPISGARVFRMAAKAYGMDTKLKAGEYQINPGASMRDVLATITSGKSVLYSLTIPEGLTVEQIWSRIAASEALTGEMPKKIPPEGALFADTQRFAKGTTREEMVAKLMGDQKKLVEEIWARRAPNLPIENVEDFVTLASIVEKETGQNDERSRVAAVFVNRLNKGMRLQSDPTILYGLFGGKGRPADRAILKSDIDNPTPYNTYTIDGLPPTPISNPGRAALEAVANPSKTNDLYFVADGTGGHAFAATLDEHNENVARWRALEKQKAEAAKAAGATIEQPGKPQP
jgi:UPF0755 protein